MPTQSHPLALVPIGAAATARAGHERANAIGCGWFDSSWDLRLGLEVRESSPAEVRLLDWLDAFLAAQPNVAGVARGEAQRALAVALPSSITAIA